MSSDSSIRFLITCVAVVALSFCFAAEANAQRGFRIGRIIQAGGGQGFRIGGERAGMHFGGGQGASIGTQNFGMRFGNGQGARFGGANYGMQFGGGQGTQIGQLQTTTSGVPGTYYYGDVRNGGALPQPMVSGQVVGKPLSPQATATAPGAPSMIGPAAKSSPTGIGQVQANGGQAQANGGLRSPSLATPAGTVGNPAATATQVDIARQTTPVGSDEANTPREPMKLEAPSNSKTKSVLIKDESAPAKPTPVELESNRNGGK